MCREHPWLDVVEAEIGRKECYVSVKVIYNELEKLSVTLIIGLEQEKIHILLF